MFEFLDIIFACVPVYKWRKYLRDVTLFGYRKKLNTLRSAYPQLNFKRMRLAKGGGSIVFIVGNKTFKVRKRIKESVSFNRFIREKRIIDALRQYCTIKLPEIELKDIGNYTFYISNWIPGVPLVDISAHRIKKYQTTISKQLAEFIYEKSKANPQELSDLRGEEVRIGYCWNHRDMCSNILINPKNMQITGIIDWEWASYSKIEDEFFGIVRYRKKLQKIRLDKSTIYWYEHILKQSKTT